MLSWILNIADEKIKSRAPQSSGKTLCDINSNQSNTTQITLKEKWYNLIATPICLLKAIELYLT